MNKTGSMCSEKKWSDKANGVRCAAKTLFL